jgi:hypothetical protein
VVVAKLGATSVLHECEIDATNWMTALRSARQSMSERPVLPAGASCSVDANGVATVLDPGARRKFVLAPVDAGEAARPESVKPPAATAPASDAKAGRARFNTVSFGPEPGANPPVEVRIEPLPPTVSAPEPHQQAVENPPTPALASPASNDKAEASSPSAFPVTPGAPAASTTAAKKFQTVGFAEGLPARRAEAANRTSSAPASPRMSAAPQPPSGNRPTLELEMLLERDEDPTPGNPLSYRERAYLLARGTTVPEAEAALRWKLSDLQKALQGRARGKLVNLAVFDHRWEDAPERPPVIVLQWRDWRTEVAVDYPAASRLSSDPPPAGAAQDDRIADVFESLEALARMRTPVEALDFAMHLLETTIPAEATSACLYDINTDELRFVAVSGTGAMEMQGRGIPRGAGLFGQAVRAEHHSSLFKDVLVEPAFDPAVDSRVGVQPRNALLRPIVHEHQLLGALQLINCKSADGFTAQDIHVMNYVAERLAEFLRKARAK